MAVDARTVTEQIVSAVERVVGQRPRPVLLHGPSVGGHAWDYVKECLDTAWVSSAGAYVERFEQMLSDYTGARHAVAVVNGTAALHVALRLAGVGRGDEVLMPALTFVATANAASYCGALPHFVDVEPGTLGMDPRALEAHLEAVVECGADGSAVNGRTGRRIAAMVPMHTFGHPVDLAGLMGVSERFGIPMVEDAAESLGSWYGGRHTGCLGRLGILSFNGNKIITTGAGGAILTEDDDLAARARHLTTTAKQAHRWEYVHDEVGYNYRMPNVNAALGCAQMEQLADFLEAKRGLARAYGRAFEAVAGARLFEPRDFQASNHWLNALLLDDEMAGARDAVLEALGEAGIQARPVWRPMHELPMYRECSRAALPVSEDLAGRLVNLPSGAALG